MAKWIVDTVTDDIEVEADGVSIGDFNNLYLMTKDRDGKHGEIVGIFEQWNNVVKADEDTTQ
jgi:hypothetical protein